MYKKLALYLILLSFSDCSVFQIQNGKGIGDKGRLNTGALQNSNLTNRSFYIQKAEVEVVSEEEKKSFLASVKFCKPDSFLISIRSKTGIEAARIFITKDTLLINDRISRKLYFGSGNDLRSKFGYSNMLLPALFGDFILNNDNLNDIENCLGEVYIVSSNYESYSLKYSIDCRSDRVSSLEIYGEFDKKPVIIDFLEIRKFGSINYYSRLYVSDFRGYNYINVKIKKIEMPYNEYIEFVPGKNYEPVRIR